MSFYTDAIETVYINPSFDSKNFRSEFLLQPGKVYLPTLRLCNIGLIKSSGTDTQFNYLVGSRGVIKHMRLLDKGVEIDSCKFCATLQGFKNLNTQPRAADKISTHLRRTQLGYTSKAIAANNGSILTATVDNANIKSIIQVGRQSEPISRESSGNIYLGEYLPILKSMSCLSTNMFRHLQLVIEYETDKRRYQQNFTTQYETSTPLLVIDEVVDKETQQKLLASLKSIKWTSYEHDRFTVPANTAVEGGTGATVEQVVDVKLNGPKNKSVGRILIAKQLVDESSNSVNLNEQNIGLGNVGSVQSVQEKYQLRINGANILPEMGVVKPNEQLALLTQAYGPITMYPFGHFGTAPTSATFANALNGSEAKYGQVGYFGITINDYVQDFQLTYKRSNRANESYYTNKALNVHVYFEVHKMLQLQGGTYRIAYM